MEMVLTVSSSPREKKKWVLSSLEMRRPRVLLFQRRSQNVWGNTAVSAKPNFLGRIAAGTPSRAQSALGEDVAGPGWRHKHLSLRPLWPPGWTWLLCLARQMHVTSSTVSPLPLPKLKRTEPQQKSWGFRTPWLILHGGLGFDALICAPWKHEAPPDQQAGWGVQPSRVLGTLSLQIPGPPIRGDMHLEGTISGCCWADLGSNHNSTQSSCTTSEKLLDLSKLQFSFEKWKGDTNRSAHSEEDLCAGELFRTSSRRGRWGSRQGWGEWKQPGRVSVSIFTANKIDL